MNIIIFFFIKIIIFILIMVFIVIILLYHKNWRYCLNPYDKLNVHYHDHDCNFHNFIIIMIIFTIKFKINPIIIIIFILKYTKYIKFKLNFSAVIFIHLIYVFFFRNITLTPNNVIVLADANIKPELIDEGRIYFSC